jgi:NADPH:quinone reductase-like Zn-dependent oxidoreductase
VLTYLEFVFILFCMKAIVYTQYGEPEVLTLKELPKLIPKDNEILIKNISTTVNSGDVRLRKADPFLVRLMFGLFKPKIRVLGNVISGKVESIGKDVTKFKVGDEVFGLNDMTMGTYAEYVAVTENTPLATRPKNMSFEEAASLVFGGHTALHFLKKAGVSGGQKILIYGASGAVGSSAIQLAKHFGAEVTAVCSNANMEMVKGLGANKVLDYANLNLSQLAEQFDVVYETVDKSRVCDMAKLVKPNGTLVLGAVIIKGMLSGLWASKKYNLKLVVGTAEVAAKDMDYLRELAENGSLKPVIDRTYSLDEMALAHDYVDGGHKKGNVMVRIG